MIRVLLLLGLIFSGALVAEAKTRVTFGTGEAAAKEDVYEYHLLKLALEVTREEYGDYEVVDMDTAEVPTYSRLRVYAEDNKFENFVYKDSASNDIIEQLYGVPFPVDLGATGYRVGFVSPAGKRKLRGISSLDELKKLTIIQGRGWLDGDILRKLGFKVVEGGNIKGLFYMAANDRADIFLIGANEIEREWKKHADVEQLNYDESLCIYYPLPKFFFLNKKNKQLANRIERGLQIAYASGQLRTLWDSYYGEALKFANLSERKIFRFDNPLIDRVDKTYEQYVLNPELL
jgi:ABC-type amino acid transport substrate-binding protein